MVLRPLRFLLNAAQVFNNSFVTVYVINYVGESEKVFLIYLSIHATVKMHKERIQETMCESCGFPNYLLKS